MTLQDGSLGCQNARRQQGRASSERGAPPELVTLVGRRPLAGDHPCRPLSSVTSSGARHDVEILWGPVVEAGRLHPPCLSAHHRSRRSTAHGPSTPLGIADAAISTIFVRRRRNSTGARLHGSTTPWWVERSTWSNTRICPCPLIADNLRGRHTGQSVTGAGHVKHKLSLVLLLILAFASPASARPSVRPLTRPWPGDRPTM
jgi:hypothetical protein